MDGLDDRAAASLDPLTQHAQNLFGVRYLYPYQRLVISNILDAEEESVARQIVVLPTGTGKSLCFQLPASLLEGLTVVVYPLLSLIGDQARRIGTTGLRADVLKGGQARQEREEVWSNIEAGTTRIVLTNPEMLAQPQTVERLSSCSVDHIVIDEAHCVSEWGETFRPSYLALGGAIAEIGARKTTAFTATASPIVLNAVSQALFGRSHAHVIQAVPDRPNIAYATMQAPSKHQAVRELFAPACCDPPSGGRVPRPAIVFCRSRRRVEDVARALAPIVGWEEVAAYHAGLTAEERSATEVWFLGSAHGVLVATCAYGMGVDKSDVRAVIHYDVPPSVEAFLQESGRSGRDGGSAASIVLYDHDDSDKACSFGDPLRQQRYRQMLAYCSLPTCRRRYLLDLLGHEMEACFGCDNCAQLDPPAEHQGNPLQDQPFVAVNQIRSSQQAVCDRLVSTVASHPRVYRRSSLAKARPIPEGWSSREADEAVSHILRSGRIAMARRGPWRDRLYRRRRSRANLVGGAGGFT